MWKIGFTKNAMPVPSPDIQKESVPFERTRVSSESSSKRKCNSESSVDLHLSLSERSFDSERSNHRASSCSPSKCAKDSVCSEDRHNSPQSSETQREFDSYDSSPTRSHLTRSRESSCDGSTLTLLSKRQRESKSSYDKHSSDYSASSSPRKNTRLEGSSTESCIESDSKDSVSLPSDIELTRVINESHLNSSSNEDSDNSQSLNQLQPQAEALLKLFRSLRPKYKIWKKINMSPMAKDKKRKHPDVFSSESESPKRKKSKKDTEHSDDTSDEIDGRYFINSCTEEDGVKRKKKKSKKKSYELETSMYEENSVEEEEPDYKKKSKKSSKSSEIKDEKREENGEKRKKHKLPHMLSSEDELDTSINEDSESPSPSKPIFSGEVKGNTVPSKSTNKGIDLKGFKIHNNIKDDFGQSSSSIVTSGSSTKLKKSISGEEENASSNQASENDSRESQNDKIQQMRNSGTGKKSANTDDDYSSADENRAEKHVKSASEQNQKEINPQKEKEYREHKFTESDDEEISRFSSLLKGKLAKDNNIWILQCPIDMDVSQLVNQELNFDGVSKFNDKKHTYEAYSYKHEEPSASTLAIPSHRNHLKVCNIPVAGNIIISESIEVPKESSFQLPVVPERVEFPTEELRPRHPLLGRCHSESSESTLHLNDSMNCSQTKKKKKKKHGVKEDENERGSFLSNASLDDAGTDVNATSLESHSPKKKKKKHKHRDEETSFTLGSEELNVSKKEKKKKNKRCSDDS